MVSDQWHTPEWEGMLHVLIHTNGFWGKQKTQMGGFIGVQPCKIVQL